MRSLGLERCPCCSSKEVCRSRVRSVWDRLVFLVLLRPVRCHKCMHRFFAPILLEAKPYLTTKKPAPSNVYNSVVDETRRSA